MVNGMSQKTWCVFLYGDPLKYYREDYLDEIRPIEDTWEDQLAEEFDENGIDYASLKGARIA